MHIYCDLSKIKKGGQKTCAHIHGSIPYILARPMEVSGGGRLRAAFNDTKMLNSMKDELLNEINTKLMETLLRKPPVTDVKNDKSDNKDEQTYHKPTHAERMKMSKTLLLYGIEVVEKIPMYGYHPSPVPFLKIKILNPKHIRLVGSILMSGVIQGVEIQPYEAHISNILQCFIDNEVSGMNYIHFQNFKFRSPMPLNPSQPSSSMLSGQSNNSINSHASTQSSSPFIGANQHRIWWSDNTDPSLVSSFGKVTRDQEDSGSQQTASQVLMGLNSEDLLFSQDSYGGKESTFRDNQEVQRGDSNMKPCRPDHRSRSKCSLEIDVCVLDIMNDKMMGLSNEENSCEDSTASTAPNKPLQKKKFRYVHSLSEIWTEVTITVLKYYFLTH